MKKYKFIDLFCGIGGFRLALEGAGCECVWSSDWNKQANKTYHANFGEVPFNGDIRKVNMADIPRHDILCGGFPCQPFSSMGNMKGFEDERQGNLFFSILDILEYHKPSAFILENVAGLMSHENGNTFSVIYNSLISLGYTVYYKILDGSSLVPQIRKRVFIVGFRDALHFEFPVLSRKKIPLGTILEPNPPEKYTLTYKQIKVLHKYNMTQRKNTHGKDLCRYGKKYYINDQIPAFIATQTITNEYLVSQEGKNPRWLTITETCRLMGFPDDWLVAGGCSENQARRQLGNSVIVPLVELIARQVVKALDNPTKANTLLDVKEL